MDDFHRPTVGVVGSTRVMPSTVGGFRKFVKLVKISISIIFTGTSLKKNRDFSNSTPPCIEGSTHRNIPGWTPHSSLLSLRWLDHGVENFPLRGTSSRRVNTPVREDIPNPEHPFFSTPAGDHQGNEQQIIGKNYVLYGFRNINRINNPRTTWLLEWRCKKSSISVHIQSGTECFRAGGPKLVPPSLALKWKQSAEITDGASQSHRKVTRSDAVWTRTRKNGFGAEKK